MKHCLTILISLILNQALFPLKPGMNEKTLGCLKFENRENTAKEFYAKVPKGYEETFSNKKYTVKAKV